MFYHPLMSRPILALRRRWLIGKRVLVGITELSQSGEVLELRQFVGRIIAVDLDHGIALQLKDASQYWLPPDHRVLKRARPGEYRLRATGEVIVDPDFITTWERIKPPEA